MIRLKNYIFSDFQENTYLLYTENDCIIIDPGCYTAKEQAELSSFIKTNNLTLQQVLFTHCHLDHVFGANYLAKTFPQAAFRAHKEDEILLKYNAKLASGMGITMEDPPPLTGFIKEGEIIPFGTSGLKALHVPGHSPGSLCYYLESDKIVFAGDALFAGSIGRTDFFGGNLDVLLANIREKLFTLPDDVIVYSGHGPATTIGKEKKHNPFLR